MINELIIISTQYPTQSDPVFTFIRPVACGLADSGIHVSVISPQSITDSIKRGVKIRPRHWLDYSEKNIPIDIYQPYYMSVSMIRYKQYLLSQLFFDIALKKAYRKLKTTPDLVYAHFWESAVGAAQAIGKNDTPLVAVSGEEHVSVFENYPEEKVYIAVNKTKGLICVSSKNLAECDSLGLIKDGMPSIVIPNAINNKIFRQMDRSETRKKLGIPNDALVAVFVGEFSNRKGVNRLIKAAQSIPELNLILIGSGDPLLDTKQIIYSGILPHAEIPVYLNAADFFVLPTLAEGCCNAIVEALACGLPIISSDRVFNYDILDNTNALLIDPENISELSTAIKTLAYDNTLRRQLSEGALKKSNELDINMRIKKIISFINQVVDE